MPLRSAIKGWLIILFSITVCSISFADDDSDIIYQTPTEEVEADYDPAFIPEDDYSEPLTNQSFSPQEDLPPLPAQYAERLASQISPPGEKLILVNPKSHVWGAYNARGFLLRAGLATAGGKWCRDTQRPCLTRPGSYRIFSLGGSECVSSLYPLGEGGAPMPYCMFFNGNQGLHGSNAVTEANISHGCVRVSVADAQWIRYQFATKGTKIVIEPYTE